MRSIRLLPNQIVTLNDFPLHNEHVLKIFFRIYQKKCGKIIPPVPVLHKDSVAPYLNGKLRRTFIDFHRRNPNANYFMLDGSHRTTAATLTKFRIKVLILKNEQDIKKAKKLAETGDLFHFYLKNTIKNITEELINHFRKKPYFQTVEQKTKKIIRKKVIPQYMIDYYKK